MYSVLSSIHIPFVSCLIMLFIYFSIGIFIFFSKDLFLGALLNIRDNTPNVVFLHPDFQSDLFFVFPKYLIFTWLSLLGFSFVTFVFRII